jgi:ligand-binding SRPBCC domain-containing protein
MKIRKKEWALILPVPLETLWDFFSVPDNLIKMTPEQAGFSMISTLNGQKIYPGMFIEHEVRPILGIPIYWVTEIVHVEKPNTFIDRQIIGPYALWHHQHTFSSHEKGVLMVDTLHYRVGMGLLGTIANNLFVERKIEEIFNFRRQAAIKLFGKV